MSCQIGFAFGPSLRFEGTVQGWAPHSPFAKVYGRTVELFFTSGKDVYYAGRFTFEDVRQRNPRGCVQIADTLGELTLATGLEGLSSDIRCNLAAAFRYLYLLGNLSAECAILRCVGFNKRLHDTCAERYHHIKNIKPEAGPWVVRSQAPWIEKKRKRD